MKESEFLKALEGIKNNELKELVIETMREKADATHYLNSKGEIIPMDLGLLNIFLNSQLDGFAKQLISWASNPEKTGTGVEGHGFALLLTHMLRTIYAGEQDIVVVQSPAALDFVQGMQGDPVDIVIGKRKDGLMVPIKLIEAKIGGHGRPAVDNNPLLKMPVIRIHGDDIFSNSRDAVKQFALNSNPAGFAGKLAYQFGEGLKQILQNR